MHANTFSLRGQGPYYRFHEYYHYSFYYYDYYYCCYYYYYGGDDDYCYYYDDDYPCYYYDCQFHWTSLKTIAAILAPELVARLWPAAPHAQSYRDGSAGVSELWSQCPWRRRRVRALVAAAM
jgi:hypothetical protein